MRSVPSPREFSLADVEQVRLFDDPLPWTEDRVAGYMTGHGDRLLPDDFNESWERQKIHTYNEKDERTRNFFAKPPRYNRAVGLFFTSRESLEVMYRKTRFVFPDWFGIVGLKCFTYSIGPLNLRASYFDGSAEAHSLKVAKKHRDPLLGSFDFVIAKLVRIKHLRQLDILLSPVMTDFFFMFIVLPRPSDQLDWPVISPGSPRLKTRFVTLECITDDKDLLNDEQLDYYRHVVEWSCNLLGFEYVKVKGDGAPGPPEQDQDDEDDESDGN
ncbi:hypothetical protein BKA81DRAFT_405689 [Phyllosticta paracitricarpa]|uniref:HNH nuclease domain-containing protein n=1 Tax=Phyllosticta paracitricarpa TaxID=2016321 RepID=A0ABR1N446_9PEZI